MAGQREVAQHVALQRPEAAAERDLLRRRDRHVAEHEHVVVQVRAVDARELGIGQRSRQVESDDFGAARGVERADQQVGGGQGHPAKIAQARRAPCANAA